MCNCTTAPGLFTISNQVQPADTQGLQGRTFFPEVTLQVAFCLKCLNFFSISLLPPFGRRSNTTYFADFFHKWRWWEGTPKSTTCFPQFPQKGREGYPPNSARKKSLKKLVSFGRKSTIYSHFKSICSLFFLSPIWSMGGGELRQYTPSKQSKSTNNVYNCAHFFQGEMCMKRQVLIF